MDKLLVDNPERVLLRISRFESWENRPDFWFVLVRIMTEVDAHRVETKQDHCKLIEQGAELPSYRFTF